ncbi:hypothetical protein EVAR_36454_1 [Eumeta japonica]|uniref:Uncharacterized protein n=1 Tax=Eumeta variegata TaxID=151549 RepID=A0A4C1VNP5_EUMVA|nr:hypothetical protein EVAR_36454_1 [Eumeta japonica]
MYAAFLIPIPARPPPEQTIGHAITSPVGISKNSSLGWFRPESGDLPRPAADQAMPTQPGDQQGAAPESGC